MALATVALCSAADAGDRELLRAAADLVPRVAAAERAADAGRAGPDAVQAQYDAARDLEEAVRPAEPVSASCRPLLRALRGYSAAEVLQVEGYDRPWPPLASRGRREAAAARAQVKQVERTCRPGVAPRRVAVAEPTSPRSDEAFFGLVEAPVPEGSAVATIRLGRFRFTTDVFTRLRWHVPASVPPGRYDLRVTFSYDLGECDRDCTRGVVVARRVWLLPRSAGTDPPRERSDGRLSARLGSLTRGFGGYAAIWTRDLATGLSASSNADARFPAASTVKLAAVVAGLRRFGSSPESSRIGSDLRAVTGWSSNAASNRLLVELGGSEAAGAAIAQRVLAGLGASSSTFTGDYRLGTGLGGRPGAAPPRISSRVTTARDLGRILLLVHEGARGDRSAQRLLGLTRHKARVALALLLSWSAPAPGDNAGNLKPSLRGVPVAQKNGWFSVVRHTAAIVYGRAGPRIVVLLTYRDGLRLAEAQRLGARVVALTGAGG